MRIRAKANELIELYMAGFGCSRDRAIQGAIELCDMILTTELYDISPYPERTYGFWEDVKDYLQQQTNNSK
jgi:hypothetical protein